MVFVFCFHILHSFHLGSRPEMLELIPNQAGKQQGKPHQYQNVTDKIT